MPRSAAGMPLAATAISLLFIFILPAISADSPSTRASGEDIRCVVRFDIADPFDYSVSVEIEVSVLLIGSDLLSSDQLRTSYSSAPDETISGIEDELMDRVRARVLDAVEGATVTVKKFNIDRPSLEDDAENAGKPITGEANLSIEIDPSQYIPEDYLSGVDGSRLTFLVTGLFQMGFTVSETYKFAAEPGESFVYNIPSHIYPLGDRSADIAVEIPGQATPSAYHVISVASGSEETVEMRTFKLKAAHPLTASEESVKGIVKADLKDLGSATVSAEAEIRSVDLAGTGIAGEMPAGVQRPAFLRSGAIRYLALEGAIDSSDTSVFRDEIAGSATERIGEALKAQIEADVDFDLGESAIDPPSTGAELNAILSSDDPLELKVTTKGEIVLNITDVYDPDDVLSLIHGGVVLKHEFDRIEDERFDLRIVMPEHLMLKGKVPIGNASGRRIYEMPWGLTGILSDKAPLLSGENVRVTGDVHMEDLRSVYLMDSVITAKADLRLELGWIAYDQKITGLETGIDYEVDYLTSDILRLALKMGLASEADLKESISDSISGFLGGAIGDDEVRIEFTEGTLDASDLGEVDGSDPISVLISVDSEIDPVHPETGPGESAASKAYIPKHINPLLPIRKYQKTVPLGDCAQWNLSINITFPVGSGVKGWLGEDGAEQKVELRTVVVDEYPTLVLRSLPGEHEALYLEISGGLYLAFDNVAVCFFMTWAIVSIFLLLIVISIVRKVRRRSRMNRVVKPKVSEEDLDPNDLWGEKKTKVVKSGREQPKKGSKGR